LEINGNAEVIISEDKTAEDSKRDGLKGYITSTTFDAAKAVSECRGL
jgi:hypothetical protein